MLGLTQLPGDRVNLGGGSRAGVSYVTDYEDSRVPCLFCQRTYNVHYAVVVRGLVVCPDCGDHMPYYATNELGDDPPDWAVVVLNGKSFRVYRRVDVGDRRYYVVMGDGPSATFRRKGFDRLMAKVRSDQIVFIQQSGEALTLPTRHKGIIL